ncbi:Delta-aminolevulinic acid dehydratase 1 [Forsythia ovata]|uniref:Delta-aminolevulinic acid dehydratase 1 n=1 Tax=Forsythia ovata TaxID=205694 RepID=A0ABD1U5Q6_9LAMI
MASSMLYSANMPLSMPRMLGVRACNTNDNIAIKKREMSNEVCEAAVVAGNIPEAPPAPSKPAAPAGTPVVPSLSLCRRPRRNRRSPTLRASFQETSLSPANLVYPLFIH